MPFTPIDFQIINSEFERLFPDLSVFEGRRFNYLKLAQHAHSFEMTEATDKLLPAGCLAPWRVFKLKQGVKRLKFPSAGFPPTSKFNLVLEAERKLQTPQGAVGPITANILKHLDDVSWWDTQGSFKQEADFSLRAFDGHVFPLNNELRELYLDLQRVYQQVSKKATSHEFLRYFESALFVFFESYRKWHWILRNAKPKRIFFICHYHNEGLIAVCKDLGVEIFELQHGLISRKDIYYAYPIRFSEYYSRAMFPDRLWVFGNYWKNLFLGCAEEKSARLEVVGDYRFEQLVPTVGKKERAFVLCSQKNLHAPYIAYIQFLKKEVLPQHPEWKLIVKLHPLEREVTRYLNEASDQVEVLPLTAPLVEALNRSLFQVSIYSTTFFDALAFGMVNYALHDTGYSSDYVEEMIQGNVALALSQYEDPIKKYAEDESKLEQLPHDEVFQRFEFPKS
jgi:hypothetical protein